MSIDPAIETRSDAVTASLEPAKNLHVVTDATGIGSRERLESLSIPLVASNPNKPEARGAAMQEHAVKKTGPFALGGNFAGSLLPLPDFQGPED
ncbi:hypothetical protein F4821DRAFT_255526 [Hypoxylon rubiginosum]|uniref:Uncharacterized protein n=1 Tax=Hypoxylon rubiginosum TaxID=110542 RepID=A0ACC0DDP6_9PEZI|nr:hypothetical protein F4821DRAFT_255526 [Hypoxylon rubiginosum]